LEKNSQKLKQKQGLFRAKKYAALFAKHHKPETDILLKPFQKIFTFGRGVAAAEFW